MNAIRGGAYALPFLLVLAMFSAPPAQAGPVEDACKEHWPGGCQWVCREPLASNGTFQRTTYAVSCLGMCIDDGDWPCELPV